MSYQKKDCRGYDMDKDLKRRVFAEHKTPQDHLFFFNIGLHRETYMS